MFKDVFKSYKSVYIHANWFLFLLIHNFCEGKKYIQITEAMDFMTIVTIISIKLVQKLKVIC